MRRAKSGDHIRSERTERRPRSQTALNSPAATDTTHSKIPQPRPPSQTLTQPNMEKALSRLKELERDQNMPRKLGHDFRRERSMDVRIESRMLAEREYRNSLGRLLDDKSTKKSKRDHSSSNSPDMALVRTSSGSRRREREREIKDSTMESNSSNENTNTDNILLQNNTAVTQTDNDTKRVNTPKSGMSYRQVFGLQSSDYLFNVTPPNNTRHRRFSDSDTESLQNFMQRIIPQDDSKPKVLQNIQPKKWIKKVRRKSETEPKRKVVSQLSK